MKVAIDSWTLASRFRNQGTYVYASNLMREFKRLTSEDSGMEFCLFASRNASNDAVSLETGSGFQLCRTRLLERDRLWRLGGAGLAAAREDADLIFCPTASTLPLGIVPLVCTIHDVSAVIVPSHSPKVNLLVRSFLWWSAKTARAIITDSQCSKNDLMEMYGVPGAKISVVYLGYNKLLFNPGPVHGEMRNALFKRLNLERPYILHHGTLQPRKNLEKLIEAYRLVLSRKDSFELDLVLAGNFGWIYEGILAAAVKPGPGRVHFTGALSDADLAMLIKGAALAVIPSLYEGFCLPMVECMACGTPTIAARSSCLPEISANKLLYFDPLSVEDMADCIERVLGNSDLRQSLAQNGKERASTFAWAKCARETLEVLKQHAGNAKN